MLVRRSRFLFRASRVAVGLVLWSMTVTHLWGQSSRIASDPYAGVNWMSDFRLKTQFHDHVRLLTDRIASYDQAGYDVVSLMHYSGASRIQGGWTEKHWPPEQWLPAEFLAGLENIRFFIPSAEEVGFQHLLSPFLTTYIEGRYRGSPGEKLPYQYESAQEAIDLIQQFDGIALLAHPIDCCSHLHGYHAVEIYNAHPEYEFFTGETRTDRNVDMVSFWDQRLMENPTLYGVAVNDWYGPWAADYPYQPAPPPWLVDSGKTIVLSRQDSMSSFRQSVESGAMLAVKDFGETKDQFPHIESIGVQGNEITINTVDNVNWISNGQLVGTGSSFDTSLLAPDARYIRAEIDNVDHSVVYTQPWAIRPLAIQPVLQPGDADQDLDFDQFDLIQVMERAKYLTGHAATWGDGDWDGAPNGVVGSPPAGDGVFDQLDLLNALVAGLYLAGPYAATASLDQTALVVSLNIEDGNAGAPLNDHISLTNAGSLEAPHHIGQPQEMIAPVPEPSCHVLLACGLAWILAHGRWRQWKCSSSRQG